MHSMKKKCLNIIQCSMIVGGGGAVREVEWLVKDSDYSKLYSNPSYRFYGQMLHYEEEYDWFIAIPHTI